MLLLNRNRFLLFRYRLLHGHSLLPLQNLSDLV